ATSRAPWASGSSRKSARAPPWRKCRPLAGHRQASYCESVDQSISRLLAHERVRAARHHLERTDEVTLARQAALSAIPAPTGAEGRRAARVAELCREVGLQDVLIDEVGNVHGWVGSNGGRADAGAQHAAPLHAPVILSAHLDTVFGPEVNVAVERRGQRLEGPGISDNARGLAALVAVAEALVAARVPIARPLLFAATVGEARSGGWGGARDSTPSRRKRGSTWTCGAKTPRRSLSSTSPSAPHSTARSTTKTGVALPARRHCGSSASLSATVRRASRRAPIRW